MRRKAKRRADHAQAFLQTNEVARKVTEQFLDICAHVPLGLAPARGRGLFDLRVRGVRCSHDADQFDTRDRHNPIEIGTTFWALRRFRPGSLLRKAARYICSCAANRRSKDETDPVPRVFRLLLKHECPTNSCLRPPRCVSPGPFGGAARAHICHHGRRVCDRPRPEVVFPAPSSAGALCRGGAAFGDPALEVQQAKYACWSPDYDLERCPWRQRVGAGIGGEDIAATRRRSSPRHVWWRDGRSTLLVSAAGSDARTKASGMMAGFPCPGAATKAAGGSADARRCRVARAAARGRPLLADREELVCRDVVHRRVYAVCDPPGRWVARESTKPCASTGMSTPPLGPTSGLLHVGQRHHARGRVPPGTHG